MKLLIESGGDYEVLYEAAAGEKGEKKDMYIHGVFLQSEKKNRNGRIYPKSVMDKEVQRYVRKHVEGRNAFGELDHPPTPTIKLERASHIITELKEDGIYYVGKAKLLPTPNGLIARSIIEGGGRLGISSRGLGTVKSINGSLVVGEDFMMVTAGDIVSTPSAQSAYLDAIMEAPEWIYDSVKNEWQMEEVISEIHKTKPSQVNEAEALRLLSKWLDSF